MAYYIIDSVSQCDSDDNWYKSFMEQYGCRKCLHLRPEYYTVPMDVVTPYKPDKAAMRVMFPPFINIARTEFLDLFKDEVRKYLRLGRVLDRNGREYPGFVTFTSDRLLPVRGSRKSSYNGICEICDRIRYIPEYPWYVLEVSLFDRPIYVTWYNSLVVNQQLYERIDRAKWKGIKIFELPIRDKPRDRIDEIPADLVIGG